MELCQACLQEHKLPETWTEVNIILLPKPGKDPRCLQSYRPISLLNSDYKILTTANRLNRVLTEYIHPDQVGFTKNRQ